MQYRQTLPLKDHEVVITFDDGPMPPYTNVILEILASQCVKANYFLVGRMANAYPSSCGASTPRAIPSAPTARTTRSLSSGCH